MTTYQDRFSGRRIAVTGGSGGIGAAVCAMLHAQGATVYTLDLELAPDPLEGVHAMQMDVTSEESIVATVRSLYAENDTPVDLVNCAGVVENNVAAEDMPMSTYDHVMGVNLRGLFMACREFGREMLARERGVIVNVASMSGNNVVNDPQRQSIYNASKAGVSALTRSLAVEWGPRGVRVNAISPGYINTPLLSLKTDMHQTWKQGIVAGRFGTVDEAAAAIAFLLSDEAGYFMGSDVLMDGGYSLR